MFGGKYLIVVAGVFTCTGQAGAQQLPDGEGKDLVMRLCTQCHDVDQVTDLKQNKDAWRKTVNKMIDRGAEGTDAEFETIINYVSKYFGEQAPDAAKVNVNQAKAEEIAAVLELSAKEAANIVKYREKNGDFKDWRDLAKVDGLDAKKIEAKKDRMSF